MTKTVLVTGAGTGIGRAVAQRFLERHARVIAVGRRRDLLERLRDEHGPDVLPVELDVGDRAAVKRTLHGLPDGWRRVDVLVNNAGLAKGLDPAHQADPDDWEVMLRTNCAGLLHCTRAVLPGMVDRGDGHIVNVGSTAATYPYPGGNVYGATKAFVRQFSLNLRADLHGTGVRVTCVEPGMIGGTEFSTVRFDGDEQRACSVYAGATPLLPADIAETIVWATSQPRHVNINTLEIMPTGQSFGPLPVHRARMR